MDKKKKMKLKVRKTKYIISNFTKKHQFMTNLEVNDEIEDV